MPLLRLAYSALYLIALIAVFVAWSQVGGQAHVDLLPWWIKIGLGGTMAMAIVRATSAAVGGEKAWNGQTLKWLGLTLALGIGIGLATYYAHTYLEESDEPDSGAESAISAVMRGHFDAEALRRGVRNQTFRRSRYAFASVSWWPSRNTTA